MAGPALEDVILDGGLTILDTTTTLVWICGAEPTSLAIAATSGCLGVKTWGAGSAFSAPTASTSPVGRKVVSTAITDGTITGTGTQTASWWAVGTAAALHAHGSLSSPQAVTNGNTFTLAAFSITIPNQ